MLAYLTFQRQKKFSRILWGFDSFQGLPRPAAEDRSFRKPKKGKFGNTTAEKVAERLNALGFQKALRARRIRLIPGFFNQSLKQFPNRPIAFLHVDCDLYRSHLEVLTTLFPQIARGGIISFDDHHNSHWPGARKAIDEYFNGSSHQISYDKVAKKYFVVKKRT